MNPFIKIFKNKQTKDNCNISTISIKDISDVSLQDQNLNEVKQDPKKRLHHDRMSDKDRFEQATKYNTYQVNGLDIDF